MTKINAYLNILNESPKIVARIEKEPVDLQIISKLIKSVFPEAAFKEPVYKSLLPLTLVATINEQGSENMRAAQENAAMLTILFGDAEEAIKFLTRYEKQYPHRERLVHDACLFSLPEGKNWNVELWQALASKHMPEKKIFRSLPFAEKIEAYVTLEFQNIKNSIRENVVHDYELTLSQEYDEEHEEKHTKLIERKINKSFQDYIKQQMNIPFSEKFTQKQIQQLRTRMSAPTEEDKEKRRQLVEEKYRHENNSSQKKHANKSTNLNKQEWVTEQLEKRKGIIEANVKSKVDNILSKNTAPDAIFSYVKKLGYQRFNENPEAAELFFQYGLPESQFDKYLTLKPVDSTEQIPDIGLIRLDDMPSLYLQKLDPKDPRAAILGVLTSCCQSLGGAGESSTIHGICDPRGGFYVLCKQLSSTGPSKQDPILSQCWAWRSEQGNIVFDSIESQINFRAQNSLLIFQYFGKLAEILVNEHQVKRVLLGQGGATPKNQNFLSPLSSDKPVDYRGYSDAIVQKILADELFKLYCEILDDPKKNREQYLELINEWCLICVINDDSEEKLMPILTALAPPGFNIAEMLDINKNFKKLLGQISSYSDDELWIALENLLKKGAYVNIPLPLGDGDRFLLDAACCLGKLSTVQLLIENGAYTTSPTRQLTLLEETILAGQSEVVAYLLTKNINERSVLTTKYNDTLLHLAKTIEVAKVILNHIDDINATNIDGETALHKAIGSAEIRPFYGEQEEKTGDLGFVKFLLENHANIDSKNEKGQTPLYLAINKQDYQIAEYLLQNKAAVEIADENENTVLHLAVKRGSLPLVKLLLRYGANVHAKNKSGATPFDIAADQPSLFEAMSIHYSAPLDDQADYPQYSEILLFLLQNGIDINNANGKSDPLLHLAIAYKDFDAVRYLVEKLGADINVKDSDGSTALSKAQNSSPAEIVKYLVEKATDIAENLDKDESKSKSNQQNIGTLAKLGTFSHREVKNSVPETGFSPKPHPK